MVSVSVGIGEECKIGNELVLGTDLKVVAGLRLTVAHGIQLLNIILIICECDLFYFSLSQILLLLCLVTLAKSVGVVS